MNSKILFTLSLFFALVFTSCSQDDTVDQQLPVSAESGEKVDVKLNFEGDVLELDDLFTRSEGELLDLLYKLEH